MAGSFGLATEPAKPNAVVRVAARGSATQVGPLDRTTDGLVGLASQLAGAIRITPTSTRRINAELGRALTDTVHELRARLAELETQAAGAAQEQLRAANEAMAAEEQRRAEIAARLDELRSAVSAEKTRLDSLVPNFQQQFTGAEAAREEQHREAVSAFDTSAAQIVENVNKDAERTFEHLRESVATLLGETTENVDAVLREVQGKRDDVDKLYRVITITGTASAFRDDAEDQKKQANLWRWIAVGFAVLAAAATAWAALSGSDASTRSLVARLSLGVAAGGIAAYAARQSARHRRREEDARRLELDLTAFGPFIESLPEEAQQQARRDFLDRIFVGRVGTSDAAVLTEESIGLMRNVVDVVLRAGRQPQSPS